MKKIVISLWIVFVSTTVQAQFEIESQLEVRAVEKHGIYAESLGFSGVFASGENGVFAIAQGKEGAGVLSHAGFGLYGVQGVASGLGKNGIFGSGSNGADGVVGIATGPGGWGVYGTANLGGEWGGYFSGGKGLLARPRLGVENFDPQYPIHVGTNTSNGNGAHVTNGGSWVSGSSRTFKEDLQDINPGQVLDKISSLKISRWKYINSDEGEHIGPMAEDFFEAFGLGDDEKYIASTDADGVALIGIQALHDMIRQLKKEITRQDIILEKLR